MSAAVENGRISNFKTRVNIARRGTFCGVPPVAGAAGLARLGPRAARDRDARGRVKRGTNE
jgi:hypothetical protein